MWLALSLVACRRESPKADPEFSDALAYLLGGFDTAAEADLAFVLRDLEGQIHEDMDLSASNPVDRSLIPARLTEADVADIERSNDSRDLSAAVPVAVAFSSTYGVEEHAGLQVLSDQTPVEPYSPEHYVRSFVEGRDCFEGRGCDVLRTSNDLTKENFLMTVDYVLLKDFRWVDLGLPDPSDATAAPGPERLAILGRSWTDRAYDGRDGNSHILQSFTVEVWIPSGGGTLRMQALWAETVFDGLSVTDDAVIATTRDGMDKNFEAVEDYLSEH